MAVSILPQLTSLNRTIISSDDRRKPRRRFCHSLSQDPQQCSAEVAALQLQNETLVTQQRAEIAAVRSDCEAHKKRWKSEVDGLRSKIRCLQAEMQRNGESTVVLNCSHFFNAYLVGYKPSKYYQNSSQYVHFQLSKPITSRENQFSLLGNKNFHFGGPYRLSKPCLVFSQADIHRGFAGSNDDIRPSVYKSAWVPTAAQGREALLSSGPQTSNLSPAMMDEMLAGAESALGPMELDEDLVEHLAAASIEDADESPEFLNSMIDSLR
jgi:hypothetical protein